MKPLLGLTMMVLAAAAARLDAAPRARDIGVPFEE